MKASLVGLVLMLVLALASAGQARGYSVHGSHGHSYHRRSAGTRRLFVPRSYNRRSAATHRFVPRFYHRKAVTIRLRVRRQK